MLQLAQMFGLNTFHKQLGDFLEDGYMSGAPLLTHIMLGRFCILLPVLAAHANVRLHVGCWHCCGVVTLAAATD
jgi:hypothetical protein